MDTFLMIISTLGVITAVIMAITVYYSNINFIIKMFALPLIFVLMTLVGYYIHIELGRPVNKKPMEFELVHFEVMDSGNSIVIWVNEDNRPRLYKFPYDRDTAKKLKEALDKKNSQKGMKVEGKFVEVEKPGGVEQTFEYNTTFQDKSQNYTK